MKKHITSIFTILLLQSSLTASAATTQYNIEMVIFEDTSSTYINSEQWPIIHLPEEDSTLSTITTESNDLSIRKLAEQAVGKNAQPQKGNSVINITQHTSDALAEHVTKLKNSRQYKVLLHQSWQQIGLSDADAVDIHINTSAKTNTTTDGTNIFDSNHPASTVDSQNLSSNVQGTIKLILGRYLHIHTDLLYNRLNTEYQPTSPTLNSKAFSQFQIKSQRRMRSNELHYIDHPLLGILVLVTPIKQTESKE